MNIFCIKNLQGSSKEEAAAAARYATVFTDWAVLVMSKINSPSKINTANIKYPNPFMWSQFLKF